jgi:septin family protein
MGDLPLFQWLHFGADKRPRQVNILLLGPTGTGKSSFVQQVTGQPVATGDGLLPCEFPLKPTEKRGDK